MSSQTTMKRQRSAALFARAARVLPGGVNSPVRAFRAVPDRLRDLSHLLAIGDRGQGVSGQRRSETRPLGAASRIASLAGREAIQVPGPEAAIGVSSVIIHRIGFCDHSSHRILTGRCSTAVITRKAGGGALRESHHPPPGPPGLPAAEGPAGYAKNPWRSAPARAAIPARFCFPRTNPPASAERSAARERPLPSSPGSTLSHQTWTPFWLN